MGIEISIIGGSGLLGSNLAKVLDDDGFLNINGSKEWISNIVILDKVVNLDYLSNFRFTEKVALRKGDVTDRLSMRRMIASSDFIYLLPAVVSYEAEVDHDKAMDVNVTGVYNVLEEAYRLNREINIVFTSSIAVFYGQNMCDDMSRANPRNFYGVTKAFGESILNYFCHKSGGKIEGVSVRLPAVISYRPRSLPPFRASTAYLSEMISKTLLGESYDIPVCKDTVIPIIGYKDAVDALKFLSSVLDKLPEERVVNIPGLSPSAEQIVNALVKYLNSSIKIRYKQDDITLKVVGTILKYVKGSALEATEYRLKRDLIGIISDVDEQIKTIKDPVSD